jgi:hypothetical protein
MPHVAPELTPVDERQVPPARHHAVVLDGVRPLVRGSRADAASLVPPQPAANSPAENVVPVQ